MSTDPEDDLIQYQDVTWWYGRDETPAIESVSLEVEKGELVGIVGRNESGKTTLVRMLNGLIPYNHQGRLEGTVTVFGNPVSETPMEELSGITGMVFSDPEAQFTHMSVEEELVFGLENLKLSKDVIGDRLDWITNALELDDLLDQPPYDLSGGQKQRVAIGSVLVMQPDVLVLDEPTSMLDPVSKERIFELVDEIRREQNLTLIIVEHNLEELVKIVDRIIHLKDGQINRDADTRTFLRNHPLEDDSVYLPEVAQLFKQLDRDTMPLTLEEAVEAWEHRD